MGHTGIVIAAGGLGTRMAAGLSPRASAKQLLPLDGRPVLWHCLNAFVRLPEIQEFVVVTPSGDPSLQAAIDEVCRSVALPMIRLVPGGAERQESVYKGLEALSDDVDLVAIHDAARPFVDPQDIRAVLEAARAHGAASPGTPVKETLAEIDGEGWIKQVPRRDGWWSLQTPQAFERALVMEAHARAQKEGWQATDDAGLVRRLGRAVRVVPGSHENIKLTTPADLGTAEAILENRQPNSRTVGFPDAPDAPGGDGARVGRVEQKDGGASNRPLNTDLAPAVRVGIGYDIHRFARGRKLVLGGVEVPSEVGLEGHSDADVIVHAVMDALLGAVGEGDIGQHFPNTDPQLRGISSVDLLTRVKEVLAGLGARPGNVDVAVVAEAPKLAPHVKQMAANIASALDLPPGSVAVKATTHERIGALGRGEGIAAWATATVIGRTDAGA